MTPCLIRVPPAPFEGELAAHFLWPLEGTQQRFVPPLAADSHNVAAVKGDRLSASDALDASDTPSLRAGRRRQAATGPKRLPASSMQDRGIPPPPPQYWECHITQQSVIISGRPQGCKVTFLRPPGSSTLASTAAAVTHLIKSNLHAETRLEDDGRRHERMFDGTDQWNFNRNRKRNHHF